LIFYSYLRRQPTSCLIWASSTMARFLTFCILCLLSSSIHLEDLCIHPLDSMKILLEGLELLFQNCGRLRTVSGCIVIAVCRLIIEAIWRPIAALKSKDCPQVSQNSPNTPYSFDIFHHPNFPHQI
jgi:hypothetical protein